MYALSLCGPGPKCCILEASFSLLKHDQSARDNRLPVQRRRLRSLRHRLVISPRKRCYPLFAYPLFKPTRELVPIGGWALKRLQFPKRPDLSGRNSRQMSHPELGANGHKKSHVWGWHNTRTETHQTSPGSGSQSKVAIPCGPPFQTSTERAKREI